MAGKEPKMKEQSEGLGYLHAFTCCVLGRRYKLQSLWSITKTRTTGSRGSRMRNKFLDKTKGTDLGVCVGGGGIFFVENGRKEKINVATGRCKMVQE